MIRGSASVNSLSILRWNNKHNHNHNYSYNKNSYDHMHSRDIDIFLGKIINGDLSAADDAMRRADRWVQGWIWRTGGRGLRIVSILRQSKR